MGNRAAKQLMMKKRNNGKALSADTCDDDLADFLATLNKMAKKGSLSVDDPAMPGTSSLRTTSAPTTPLKDRRSRLQRSTAVAEDLGGKLDLTPEQATALDTMMKKDDHPDWSEMKEWLVWCMNANLKDEVESYRRNNVENQSSLESNAET